LTAASAEFFACFFAAWTLFALFNVYPGYVHYDTAEIAMWSSLDLGLGYRKHPPFLPWLFKLYAQFLPLNWVTLSVLAGLNVTLGAYAVWRIACLVLGLDRAPVAMAIYLASPYATWLPLKLDHNAVLVSLWPLVVWVFIEALRKQTVWRGIMLGLACAAALYAKYISLLLLAALAIASTFDRRRELFWRSPAPWIAFAVSLALFAPHLLWAIANPVESVGLVTQDVIPGSPVQIAFRNLMLLSPALLMTLGLAAVLGPARWPRLAELPVVAMAVFGTYAGILILTLLLRLRGSPAWTMPALALLPLLLATPLAAPAPRMLRLMSWASRAAFLVIVFTAPLFLAYRFKDGDGAAAEPRQELARAGIAVWQRATGIPLRIVAGEHRFAMAAHLESADRPHVWSMFEEPTPWITPALIDRDGLLAFCLPASSLCQKAEALAADHGGWTCPISAHRTLYGTAGPELTLTAVVVPPRFMPPRHYDCRSAG
jgi:hypothetical protein